jgi:hypothetical protein
LLSLAPAAVLGAITEIVEGFADEAYDRKMESLEMMVNHFLRAGEMLKIVK